MATVKLKVKEFDELTKGLTENELSNMMNISTTQLWRVRLTDDDSRHNDPGREFIAGVLKAFPNKKFEDLFFIVVPLRERNGGEANVLTGTG